MKIIEQIHQEIIKSDWTKYFEVVKRMNWKQQRLEELQKELDDSEEWILNNWMELPKSVRSIIAYGLNSTKETIKELKK